MVTARLAQRIADFRCRCDDALHSFALRVEHPQRTRLALCARLAIELGFVLVKPGVETLEVSRPALTVADRVELKRVVLDAELPQEGVVELNELRVDRR